MQSTTTYPEAFRVPLTTDRQVFLLKNSSGPRQARVFVCVGILLYSSLDHGMRQNNRLEKILKTRCMISVSCMRLEDAMLSGHSEIRKTNSTCSQTYVKAEKAILRSRPVASRVRESEWEWGGKR